jgi:hypothetical protein
MHFLTIWYFYRKLVDSCLPFYFICSFDYAFCSFNSFLFFLPPFISKTSFLKFNLPK